MHLSIDHEDLCTADPKRLQMVRAAAYFLLHTIGDLNASESSTTEDTITEGSVSRTVKQTVPGSVPPPPTFTDPSVPPVAHVVTAPAVPTAVAAAAVNTSTIPPAPTVSAPVYDTVAPPIQGNHVSVPPPPPPPTTDGDYDDETGEPHSNVVNFPLPGTVPPPPASNSNAATAAPLPSHNATSAAAAPAVASAEYDSAGMPWDARIHQKAKGKKKDNTWKLIKGIDPAIVQTVTAELAARKGASAPVSLPLPVPPVANVPAPPGVPAPPATSGAPVPVPPVPAAGVVGVSAYRALIDKITDLTRSNKITPAKVSEICQVHGAPSLMALNTMQGKPSAYDSSIEIVEAVSKWIDAVANGLL